MSELTGINLAMQTPMHADGSIDYARWEELIDLYIDAGVHGLVLGAGTGQHPYLTQQECSKLYELGARRIDGRCKLICQTSALVLDEIVERSKHAQGLGAELLQPLPGPLPVGQVPYRWLVLAVAVRGHETITLYPIVKSYYPGILFETRSGHAEKWARTSG